MQNITNNGQLGIIFNNIAENVIGIVSEKMYDSLQEIIQRDVYDAAEGIEPRKWYLPPDKKPTYEFKKAFHFEEIRSKLTEVTRRLFYDWMSMSVGTTNEESADGKSGTYVHTQGGDFRQQMAEAFNIDGFVSGDFNNVSRKREPYWDNFIMLWFDAEILDGEFTAALAQYGFKKL